VSYAGHVGSTVWLASVTGLIGVVLGGLVSLAVSRQQIREARKQRADQALEERYRRSVERRFKAYSEFINCHRSVQHAVNSYYSQVPGSPSVSDITALLQSANNASAMVFLVAETERTNKACIGVLHVLRETQRVVGGEALSSTDSPRSKLNIQMGRAMREFENAARTELGVGGPEWTWGEVPRSGRSRRDA
jgi:hypothetical protein